MIPRTLLRKSRAFSSSIRSVPRASLARPQFRPSQLSIAPTSRPAAARWYSSEPEATKEGETAKEAETPKEAEDPVKKELEAKNKEIVDLKVCRH
jgi:molecular chaperone GrpE